MIYQKDILTFLITDISLSFLLFTDIFLSFLLFTDIFLSFLLFADIFIILGNPQGSHTVRTARQLILDNFNQSPEKIAEKTKLEYKAYLATQAALKTKDGKKSINVGGENVAFDAKSAAQTKAKTDSTKVDNDEMTMVRHFLISYRCYFLSNYIFGICLSAIFNFFLFVNGS